jgi:light-regulated signal transduction histidine kinase (bacteriophytochrome)
MTDVQVDLTNCDREPIHLLEQIQPFGALIAVDSDWLVGRWSANVQEFLGLDRPLEAGFPLRDILAHEAVDELRDAMGRLDEPEVVERLFGLDLLGDGTRYDVAIHLSGRLYVVEIERHDAARQMQSLNNLRPLTRQLEATVNADELNQRTCDILRGILGMDRVMLYKFHRDDTGEVIAESRTDETESFFGLRYPASDIPKQARALYVRNLLRIIADVNGETVPVMPPDSPRGPLDLSLSTLRAVSSIHIEYLKNMGIEASLSISVVVRGKLWGLFACHHSQPLKLPFSVRTAAELLAQMFALTLDQRISDSARQTAERGREIHDRVMIRLADEENVADNLPMIVDSVKGQIPHDGASAYIDGNYVARGDAPTEEEFMAIVPGLQAEAAGDVMAAESLANKIPAAEAFADRVVGALAIPVSRMPRDYLVLWRKELKKSVTWAGNPDKPVVKGPHGDRLNPRKSFAAWEQQVEGYSAEWSEGEVRLAQMMRVTLLEVLLRIAANTMREREESRQKQDLLIAELNHRVRNILTLIRGLIGQSRHEAEDVSSFAELVGGRIRALASAHDALTAENWSPASLKHLIEVEAEAYVSGKADRVVIEGADALLHPTAYSTMALVIHEMMTNAAKYGALCDRTGSVTITLSSDKDGDLRIAWRETGGPAVQAPERRGFGSTIIERSIPYELKGDARIRYKLGGVEADFCLPDTCVASGKGRAAPISQTEVMKGAQVEPLKHVLLVEDNIIIAMDTEETLRELGVAKVDMASSVKEARALVEAATPELAVLDFNLGDETSEPLARELIARGVPVAMATGYGEAMNDLEDIDLLGVLAKPYDRDDIEGLFHRVRDKNQ